MKKTEVYNISTGQYQFFIRFIGKNHEYTVKILPLTVK